MRKLKLFSLALMALFSMSMWGATETPGNTGSKDGDVSGTSYTIPGTYVAGKGGTKVSPMVTKGVKVRLTASGTNNSLAINVKEGYKITAFTIYAITNTDNASCTATVKIDGESAGENPYTIAAKNASTATTISLSNITATENIVLSFENVGGDGQASQGNFDFHFTYEPLTYTITYDKGAYGTGTIAAGSKSHGVDFTLSSNTFTRDGYNQEGWSTTDGGVKAYELGGTYTANADITLYPFWVQEGAVSHTITYDEESLKGQSVAGYPTSYYEGVGVASFAPLNDIEGFHFTGWSPASIGTDATTDQTITAQWCTSITPTLSYNYSIVYPDFASDILPTLEGNTGSGAVTYESSDNAIAEVDESTGAITPVAVGTVTITATIAAVDDYCESIAQATIKVITAPTKLIEQRLAYGNNVPWDASVIVTNDNTNISNLVSLSQHGSAVASGNGNNNNGGQTAKVGTIADENENNYLELSFVIAEGKQLSISAITIPVQPVSSDDNNFKAVLSDNKGHNAIQGTKTNVTNGTLVNIDFSSYGTLAGTATLKLYAWGWTAGYRLGKEITIEGAINDIPTALDNTETNVKAVKRLENGMLVIEKNGVRYNAQGQVVR